MTALEISFAKYLIGLSMVFVIITVLLTLAGVFIGGILVYKTRYAGRSFADKKPAIPEGDASQASDDFPLEEDILGSTRFQPKETLLDRLRPSDYDEEYPGDVPDEEGNDSKVDKALKNILSRNAVFNQQSNRR